MPELTRRPPRDVLRTLRREAGFRCPVEGCGNPYLTWHHFGPPWRIERHDRFRAEFINVENADALIERYAGRGVESWVGGLSFPLTVVELSETAAGTQFDLQPRSTQVMSNVFVDCFFEGGRAAFSVVLSPDETARLFPEIEQNPSE